MRRAPRKIVLSLELDPPGRIVIDRLDMRIADCHILISRKAYAIGRYLSEKDIFWMYAEMGIVRGTLEGAAIEFAPPHVLQERLDRQASSGGQWMCTPEPTFAIGNNIGAMFIATGLAIGTQCGSITISRCGQSVKPLTAARRAVFGTKTDIADLFKV